GGWLAGRHRLPGGGAERVLGGFVSTWRRPPRSSPPLSRTRISVHSAALGAFAASTVLTMALAHVLCG
ncbi:hypothetical protein JNW88_22140, partial [Micromonospora sp. ATA32]|nr:hypothetical protein [Micromonospora sp. ATA32]